MLISNAPILAITNSCEDLYSLTAILAVDGWISRCVSNCRDAVDYLGENPTRLILCESRLPDGDWKTVLNAVEAMPNAPLLVVFSDHANDSLWAEVLNLGGYDVLVKPFDRKEVQQTVAAALRNAKPMSQ